MNTKLIVIRRLLGFLVLPAALALPLLSATDAWAQDESAAAEEGGEEEDFYRASDPEDPLIRAAENGPPEFFHNVGVDVRGLLPLGARSDLDADDTPAAVQLHWLWQVMAHDSWFHIEIGVELGMVTEAAYSSEQMSPQIFADAIGDYESGVEDAVSDHTANAILSDVSMFYGGAVARIDLQGLSRWDIGPSLSLDVMQATIDTSWGCEICDGSTATVGEGDATTVGLMVRVGGFFGYQFDHVWLGVEIGVSMYLGAEPPNLGHAGGGVSVGWTF